MSLNETPLAVSKSRISLRQVICLKTRPLGLECILNFHFKITSTVKIVKIIKIMGKIIELHLMHIRGI